MNLPSDRLLLAESKAALRGGDRLTARRLAQQVVAQNPESIEGWLILGGLSSPKASLAYLQIAHNIAPDDPRVKSALEWAQERTSKVALDKSKDATRKIRRISLPQTVRFSPPVTTETHRPVWLWTLAAVIIMTSLMFGLDLIPSSLVGAVNQPGPLYAEGFTKPSLTPTLTFTPTPTHTPTNTPTAAPTNMPTDTPTLTPTSRPTNTQQSVNLPSNHDNERWIDIVLSEQRLDAYEGQTLVRSFVVSTGKSDTPTSVGTYKVWTKLRYTDMSGPGYYLKNVPYTMYFYKGYGIHGTYWHNNFGTPMSRGCVNMKIEDAGWLYGWSHVGIVVNVRP